MPENRTPATTAVVSLAPRRALILGVIGPTLQWASLESLWTRCSPHRSISADDVHRRQPRAGSPYWDHLSALNPYTMRPVRSPAGLRSLGSSLTTDRRPRRVGDESSPPQSAAINRHPQGQRNDDRSRDRR